MYIRAPPAAVLGRDQEVEQGQGHGIQMALCLAEQHQSEWGAELQLLVFYTVLP